MTEQFTNVDKVEALWQGKLSPKAPDGNPLPFPFPASGKGVQGSITQGQRCDRDEKAAG